MKCPFCGKESEDRGLFCCWCGAKLTAEASEEEELIRAALDCEDPVRQHEKLLEAQARFPNSREVRRRLLYLGRMYERGGKPDFYRIPFWPLNALEKPRDFSARERKKMLDSFFRNPEIDAVGALFPDAAAFRQAYFDYMADRYVDMFIKSATSNNSFLGFRRRPADVTARCETAVVNMIAGLRRSEDVPEADKRPMEKALAAGFERQFGADAGEHLKNLL